MTKVLRAVTSRVLRKADLFKEYNVMAVKYLDLHYCTSRVRTEMKMGTVDIVPDEHRAKICPSGEGLSEGLSGEGC